MFCKVFLWNLRNFQEHLFLRTYANDYFWTGALSGGYCWINWHLVDGLSKQRCSKHFAFKLLCHESFLIQSGTFNPFSPADPRVQEDGAPCHVKNTVLKKMKWLSENLSLYCKFILVFEIWPLKVALFYCFFVFVFLLFLMSAIQSISWLNVLIYWLICFI